MSSSISYCIGWLFKYTLSGKTNTLVSEGLMNRIGLRPIHFSISSDKDTVSVLWVARSTDLEMKKVHYIDMQNLHVTSSVTIKNLASTAMSNLYCKCNHCIVTMNNSN
jgi:hypothetical protein